MGGGGRDGAGNAVARVSRGAIDGGGLVGGGFAAELCRVAFVSLFRAATAELTRVPRTLVVLTVELFGSSGDGGFFVETAPNEEDLG